VFFGLIRAHPRPRYVPERPFPAYQHEPDITPHPYREEGGHSFGQDEPTVERLDPSAPLASTAYLYGFDLFNHGYFWESHVWWEALWQAEGRRGDVADVLKALIRLAAAGVKGRAGQNAGLVSHCEGAAELLDGVRARTGARWLIGIDLKELAQHARSVANGAPKRGRHADLAGDRFAWSLRPGDPKGRGALDPRSGLSG
jgi:hypothetical protein